MTAFDLLPLGAALAEAGLVRGKGGNLSFRDGGRIVITARGAPLAALQATDLVALDQRGKPVADDGPAPSSEWAMHVVAHHLRPKERFVIHAHPPQAIALGLLGRELPALTPDQYLHLGPRVPLVPYLAPTTHQLAKAIAEPLREAPALLLQNHGVLLSAASLEQALLRLTLLEEGCAIFLAALRGGEPRPLSEADQRDLDRLTEGRYRV